MASGPKRRNCDSDGNIARALNTALMVVATEKRERRSCNDTSLAGNRSGANGVTVRVGPQGGEIGSVTGEQREGVAGERRGSIAHAHDVDRGEMSDERGTSEAADGRQGTEPRIVVILVAANRSADGLHAAHSCRPFSAAGESTTEIIEAEHGEDGFECVSVDAHRRGHGAWAGRLDVAIAFGTVVGALSMVRRVVVAAAVDSMKGTVQSAHGSE